MEKMLRSLSVVITLGALAVAPALPDLINVSVNGSVSGSGYTETACILGVEPGCTVEPSGPPLVTTPDSLSGTNTELGSYSAANSSTGPLPGVGGEELYANETTSVCVQTPTLRCQPASGDALYIQLTGGHSAGPAEFYSAQESENVSISFDLTEESLVTLYSEDLIGTGSNGGEVLDSMGNVIFQIPVDSTGSSLLQPGMYQLDAAVNGRAQGLYQSGDFTDSNLLLTAQFEPVPEPRWAVLVLFAIALAGLVVSRRRRVS